ncbi:MAG: aminodeoxychorismate/anthranilate synthase component II [Candidatus Dadabacteria bacterium]|nr:aminodeoxychorismate/anthranilate synthase component II [Candidatus Dadabacteria bacterium]MYA48358.1 aminodeoxychorismate/anthranilate synthase component II [Candidatus Dadabacteria bacterium]MYF48512.1 aminodeoxychorismate/anthranilate synthase component II [Candidatus Dadabacteria bacterium]MYG83598.1 aminodeoxychorismate/anthranilate synthase component II [Candidatus Dadabacteria bacterium]MYK49237.1 aminodeoxychorismate/anthranilate synthase component II [Candidatus Dadabacteria bacteri
MILMIDNYDSFTYNLVHYLGELGQRIEVKRNDCLDFDFVDSLDPDMIVISPGPCTPKEAGLSVDIIKRYVGKKPILGVCLGHQAVGYAHGANIVRAERLLHGKTSPILHDGKTIFKDLPNPFEATRYHSLLVEEESLPPEFEISAWTEEGEIMGIRHREFPVEGVQFHPESILTECGKDLLRNFVDYYG